jgi:hypothetical protein
VFALSPGGQTLAGAPALSDDSSLHVWNVETGTERRFPSLPEPRTFSLAFSPDGRMLARGCADGSFELRDLATGGVRRKRTGHQSTVYGLTFAPDGRTLASASEDTTALLWDVLATDTPEKRPSPERLNELWAALAGDARGAFDAITALVAFPDVSVPFLKEHLRPVAKPDSARLAKLLEQLDAEAFTAREAASAELSRIGQPAAPALRETLAKKPSAEVCRRAEALLREMDNEELSPEQLRVVRSIEALEYIATPAARELLEKLAAGAPEARLTREAKATLERLAKRKGGPAGSR